MRQKLVDISVQQFFEYLSVLVTINLFYCGQILSIVFTCYLLFYGNIYWKVFIITYIIYIIFDRTEETGNRPFLSNWFRSLKLWKYFGDYFPAKLIKTADLPPDKNYIFGCHPHGILCYGIFAHFATEGTGFKELFPGIKANLCTLKGNFWHPFYRQIILLWNSVACKYSVMKFLLSQSSDEIKKITSGKFTSNGLALLVGGTPESMLGKRFQYIIYIKKRKGFIKLAIQSGASIVPVFSFGENDLYDMKNNDPGTWWRWFQETCQKISGFVPIIMNGRGYLHYFGLMPMRTPINTVVGAPIHVLRNEKSTQEEIDELHEKYVEAISNIFEEHKWKYVRNAENVELIMV